MYGDRLNLPHTKPCCRRLVLCLYAWVLWPISGVAVDATVGTGVPGSCTEAALTAAINQVQADIQGGTVSFNCGVLPTQVITLSSSKTLTGVITIDGGGAVELDGQNAIRILQINPRPNPEDATVVTLRNLQMRNGMASGDFGGAVLGNAGVQLNLEAVSIRDSTAGLSGGALAMAPNTTLTISDSEFRNNTAPDGGALATSALTTIQRSRFVLNTATGGFDSGRGGAIQSYVSNLVINQSTFSFNQGRDGGAIYKRGALLTVDGSHLENNLSTVDGGAIYAESNVVDVQLFNSQLQGNLASGRGGALHAPNTVIQSCLFDNNRAAFDGGAIALRPASNSLGSLIFVSTLSNNFGAIGCGGVDMAGGTNSTLSVDQITTANNEGEGSGGDFCFSGPMTATITRSSLINGRSAVGATGGSIFNEGASVRLGQSLIFSAQGQDCAGTGSFQSLGANLGAASCNLNFAGTSQTGADIVVVTMAQLGLGMFANYGGRYQYYLPNSDSPALNRYECTSGVDARERPLPVGTRCDAGAVERQLVEWPPALFRDGFE